MSDKFRPGIPVRTTFVDGENLPAAKLNSLSAQLQRASQNLEAAIGDLHGYSYPYSSETTDKLSPAYGKGLANSETRSLDIVNIGRLIGPASNLNPHVLGDATITESIPEDVHEFSLNYVPDDPSVCVFSDTVTFDTYRADVADLNAAGDYYIDAYGRVYSVSLTLADTTVTYDIVPENWSGLSYHESSFNVIPDLNQLELGDGCTVSAVDINNRRTITLPIATHHAYNQTETSITLTAQDPLFEQQLYLPQVIRDAYLVNEEIPAGFIYLKNHTTNEVYTDATYYYNNSTSILIGNTDITEAVDDGDVFCIITVGTDITTSIDDLRKRTHHNHDRSMGEPSVLADALAGILALETPKGWYAPSEIVGNRFPQYLHRDGYDGVLDNNINDGNCMRGDLCIGVEGADAGTHRETAGESYKVRFHGLGDNGGDYDEIPDSIVYRKATGNLCLKAAESDVYNDELHIEMESIVRVDKGLKTEHFTQVTGESDWAIKPFAFKQIDLTPTLDVVTLNLDTDYGIDENVDILNVSVEVSDTLVDVWYSTNDTATRGMWFSTSLIGASWLLAVNLPGTSWVGDVDIRVVVWYSN